jgi:hypothetical protein
MILWKGKKKGKKYPGLHRRGPKGVCRHWVVAKKVQMMMNGDGGDDDNDE